MLATLKFLARDETAAAAVEYALLLALIALAAFFALHNVGRSVDRVFDAARNALRRS